MTGIPGAPSAVRLRGFAHSECDIPVGRVSVVTPSRVRATGKRPIACASPALVPLKCAAATTELPAVCKLAIGLVLAGAASRAAAATCAAISSALSIPLQIARCRKRERWAASITKEQHDDRRKQHQPSQSHDLHRRYEIPRRNRPPGTHATCGHAPNHGQNKHLRQAWGVGWVELRGVMWGAEGRCVRACVLACVRACVRACWATRAGGRAMRRACALGRPNGRAAASARRGHASC